MSEKVATSAIYIYWTGIRMRRQENHDEQIKDLGKWYGCRAYIAS